jgi:hypothetical protein
MKINWCKFGFHNTDIYVDWYTSKCSCCGKIEFDSVAWFLNI